MEIDQKYMVQSDNFLSSPYANKKKTLYTRDLNDIEELIIHCTATSNWEDPISCIKYDLGANHISRSGLATATYHYYINQKGNVWQLVSMNIRTSHCSNHNAHSVAICINHNGFKEEEITPELYSSLVDTICHVFDKLDWGYDYYGVKERLHFHREFAPKACPGCLNLKQLVNDVTERLKTWGDNA